MERVLVREEECVCFLGVIEFCRGGDDEALLLVEVCQFLVACLMVKGVGIFKVDEVMIFDKFFHVFACSSAAEVDAFFDSNAVLLRGCVDCFFDKRECVCRRLVENKESFFFLSVWQRRLEVVIDCFVRENGVDNICRVRREEEEFYSSSSLRDNAKRAGDMADRFFAEDFPWFLCCVKEGAFEVVIRFGWDNGGERGM